MIDNLVQIGHNVEVGQGAAIVARAGIAGSTTFGDHVFLATQSGTAGHPRIGVRDADCPAAGSHERFPSWRDGYWVPLPCRSDTFGGWLGSTP